jgi:cytochrome c553
MKLALLLIASSALIASPAVAADAAVIANYNTHCASCHGKDGTGKTTMGRKVRAKDFTDPKVVAEINDEKALKMLKEGLKDKTGKEIKKPFASKLKEEEMKALIKYTREFAKK